MSETTIDCFTQQQDCHLQFMGDDQDMPFFCVAVTPNAHITNSCCASITRPVEDINSHQSQSSPSESTVVPKSQDKAGVTINSTDLAFQKSQIRGKQQPDAHFRTAPSNSLPQEVSKPGSQTSDQGTGHKALALLIRFDHERSFSRTQKFVPRDLKVDCYYNGNLVVSTFLPSRLRTELSGIRHSFSGRRIDQLIECPWVLVPPAQRANKQSPGKLHCFDFYDAEAEAEMRWDQISQSISDEANRFQLDQRGRRPPSGMYLNSLAQVRMPPVVKDMQTPNGPKFGVVDVVISLGTGKKHLAGAFNLKKPTLLKDPTYSIPVEPRISQEQILRQPWINKNGPNFTSAGFLHYRTASCSDRTTPVSSGSDLSTLFDVRHRSIRDAAAHHSNNSSASPACSSALQQRSACTFIPQTRQRVNAGMSTRKRKAEDMPVLALSSAKRMATSKSREHEQDDPAPPQHEIHSTPGSPTTKASMSPPSNESAVRETRASISSMTNYRDELDNHPLEKENALIIDRLEGDSTKDMTNGMTSSHGTDGNGIDSAGMVTPNAVPRRQECLDENDSSIMALAAARLKNLKLLSSSPVSTFDPMKKSSTTKGGTSNKESRKAGGPKATGAASATKTKSAVKQKKKLKASASPMYPGSAKAFDIPDLCKGSVITYLPDLRRQIRSERDGEFRETEILMGVRYVVSGVSGCSERTNDGAGAS